MTEIITEKQRIKALIRTIKNNLTMSTKNFRNYFATSDNIMTMY